MPTSARARRPNLLCCWATLRAAKAIGRHLIMPLHADIQVSVRELGLDVLTPILWHKVANGVTEAEGNGAGFTANRTNLVPSSKMMLSTSCFFGRAASIGTFSPSTALSMLNKDEMQSWLRSSWSDIRGASLRNGHQQGPFPTSLAERLIKLFSFAGDTVLDPFGGTGSTAVPRSQPDATQFRWTSKKVTLPSLART